MKQVDEETDVKRFEDLYAVYVLERTYLTVYRCVGFCRAASKIA